MNYKPRTKSKELIILELLNKRKKFTSKEKQHYLNLKKGYDGEVLFDSFTEKLRYECMILNDLLLEVNNTSFQIDSIIIKQGKLHFYEVKNYEGDYYYQSDKLFKKPNLEVINPLHQLSRSESLLRQLLLNCGYRLQIDASIVFINPTFTLYQAPLDKPIIYPTQIGQYIKNLDALPSKLTEKHKELANQLLSLHITDSPFEKIPPYDYDQLQKGISCLKCHSLLVSVEKSKCVCQECQNEELFENAVMRSINEFKLLFPDKKITTKIIHDWCGLVGSDQTIRSILLNNFSRGGKHRWSYYE